MLYWPCADYRTESGEVKTISTYNAATSFDQAKRQIDIWRDHYNYNIVESWIDFYEKGNKIKSEKV